MYRPRLIPVLLLQNKGLVKSVRFKKHRYIGDPINAVKIFNDLSADELVFLDILASKENRMISLDFVRKVGEEANMPFAVGGGITQLKQIQDILAAGAEKVIINTHAVVHPDFIKASADDFGSSTIVVCIDVKKNVFGKNRTWINAGTKSTKYNPVELALLMQEKGAGELIIQSIEHDGMMNGYDIELIKKISDSVNIPVVALGGAGNLNHIGEICKKVAVSGISAGSIFIYHGLRKGILINYPDENEKKELLRS